MPSVTNTGTLEATADGTLTLSGDTVTNSGGVVEVVAGSTLDFAGSSISGGTVDVYGTLDSTGTGSISDATIDNTGTLESTSGTLTIDPGSIDNSGLLEANGGALTIDATPVTNTGTLEATADGTLTLSGDTVTNSGGVVEVVAGSTLDFAGSSISGGTVDVYGTLDSTGTGSISDATIDNTGTLESTSGTLTIDPGSIDNSGLLEANGGALTIDATPVTNTGTLEATDDSTLTSSAGSTVNNSQGTLNVQYGSTIDIAGAISGGNAVIDGGTLIYGGTSSVTSSFDGIGMLVLDGTNTSDPFTGTVSDFGNGDIIDLAGIAYSKQTDLSYDGHDDTLTVSDGSHGPSITIQLAGSYDASSFVLSNDGNGDAEVTFTAGEAHEAPTLWLDAATVTVSQDGTVTLPSIRVIRVDFDDTLTLTIAGLPTGATITESADAKVFSGSSFTLTGSEVGSALTLHDGGNTSNFMLTVTANNTTPGEAASSAPKRSR